MEQSVSKELREFVQLHQMIPSEKGCIKAFDAASQWESADEAELRLCVMTFDMIAESSQALRGAAYQQLGEIYRCTHLCDGWGDNTFPHTYLSKAAELLAEQAKAVPNGEGCRIFLAAGSLYIPEKEGDKALSNLIARDKAIQYLLLAAKQSRFTYPKGSKLAKTPWHKLFAIVRGDKDSKSVELLKQLLNELLQDMPGFDLREGPLPMLSLLGLKDTTDTAALLEDLLPAVTASDKINEFIINLAVTTENFDAACRAFEKVMNAAKAPIADLGILNRYALLVARARKQSFRETVIRFGDRFVLGRTLIWTTFDERDLETYGLDLYGDVLYQSVNDTVAQRLNQCDGWLRQNLLSELRECPYPNMVNFWLEFLPEVFDNEIRDSKYADLLSFRELPFTYLLRKIIDSAAASKADPTLLWKVLQVIPNHKLLREVVNDTVSRHFVITSGHENLLGEDRCAFYASLLNLVDWHYEEDILPESVASSIPETARELVSVGAPRYCEFLARKLYFGKNGCQQDVPTAVKLFMRAAENRDPVGQVFTGHAYAFGSGVEKDILKGLIWLGAAQAAGRGDAALDLGTLCETAFRNSEAALEWFKKSHACGYADGTFRYGLKLVELNRTAEGLALITEAAHRKNKKAKEWIEANDCYFLRRFISLSIETTGDSVQSDRVCEIGAVEFDPKTFEKQSQFRVYINPQKPMPIMARLRHGLNDAFLKGKSRFVDEADDFLTYIRDATLFIHEAEFVMFMLDSELKRNSRPLLEKTAKKIVSIRRIGREVIGEEADDLDTLCKAFKVDTSERGRHGALVDAKLLLQLMKAMSEKGIAIPELPKDN